METNTVAGKKSGCWGWPAQKLLVYQFKHNLIVIMSSFVLPLHSLNKHFINPDIRVRKSVMR